MLCAIRRTHPSTGDVDALLIQLPLKLERKLEAACLGLATNERLPGIDFERPLGEKALIDHRSVSWRVFKNPVSVFIGGVAAVILELAEPSVRTGVWQYSGFLTDPGRRVRRTGAAALLTVYGAQSVARPMIERVTRMHAKIRGVTPDGVPFSAADADLLQWVHGTAAYGFVTAYSRYATPLTGQQIDAFYGEGVEVARLYGADAPGSRQGIDALFQANEGRLERSQILFDFLDIIRTTPALPRSLLWLQRLMVRAAVDLVPQWARERLELDGRFGLRTFEASTVRVLASIADRIVLPGSAPGLACVRLGLTPTYLYRKSPTSAGYEDQPSSVV
jgi:uncharacterized protein (DUF2236 family)